MGKDILVRKKGDRRFLGTAHHVFEDDGGTNFCLERFRDCSFFNQQQDSTRSTAADHLFDADAEIAPPDAAEERRVYWESQQFLLQEILEQYHSIGSKLREQMKRQIEIARESSFCNCQRDCVMCLRRAVVNQLFSKGLNASLRISQWKRTHKTPAGSHEYIEVNVSTVGKRKQITFVVELGFRDEFRMAKACEEYNTLVKQLPEIYIGRSQHMNGVIRLMCEAGKKSAEEQGIHMGPWRKKSFMQMKWSASSTKNIHHATNEVRSSSSTTLGQECAAARFQLPTTATLKVA